MLIEILRCLIMVCMIILCFGMSIALILLYIGIIDYMLDLDVKGWIRTNVRNTAIAIYVRKKVDEIVTDEKLIDINGMDDNTVYDTLHGSYKTKKVCKYDSDLLASKDPVEPLEVQDNREKR